jgi:DUF2934 family protein
MAIPHNFTAVRDIVEGYLVVNVQLMGNTDVVALLRKNHYWNQLSARSIRMARKTEGNIASRRKKANSPTETAAVQPATEQAVPEVRNPEISASEHRSNVTPINVAPVKPVARKTQNSNVNLDKANLDEEIRRRAYELYQEREGAPGDPAADWTVAEREVRARHARQDSALAATHGS